ncbi:MAG: hypothetical protein HYZ29_02030 [Myxococcales bacterium]|nr:hypothetical protein [Myxococcales bacterium]
MPTALICPWCGAPLPAAAADRPFATCAYCGATASLTGVRATKAEPSTGATASAISTADPALQLRVIESFKAARQRGDSSYDALRAAARERLGPLGETDAFARVCLSLANDFDAKSGTKTADDPMCVGRLIEIYLKAIEALRTQGSYAIHLPFFAATPSGPLALQRTLSVEDVAELAAREPVKKRGFWPFG